MMMTSTQDSSLLPPSKRRSRRALAVLLCLLPLLAACEKKIRFGNPHVCERPARQHLINLGIPPEQVRDLTVRSQKASGRGPGRVVGTQAWARLKTCKGHVVLDLQRECGLRHAYTTRDCKVPGVARGSSIF